MVELFQIGRLYHCGKFKLDGLIFWVDNLSTYMLDHPNLNFLVRKGLGKFNTFYTLILCNMIKMIGDTIVMDGGVGKFKKLGTYKGGVFTVKREPEKHTMRKLNAYGFNADCLNMIYKANPDAKIVIIQKNVLSKLTITIKKALEVGTYLSFNGELQLFIPKDKFEKVY